MKKYKYLIVHSVLVVMTSILFNCNKSDTKFTIEEINTSVDSIEVKKMFSFKSIGSHFYTSSSKKGDLQTISISFNKKQLSTILEKLEYNYNKKDLKTNPILNLEYYKENTTKELAVKEIIARLKNTYPF